MDRAEFMKGRGGVSDNLYGDNRRAHDAQNRSLNKKNGAVHNNIAGPNKDNQGYRKMPGRKNGMFSGS